MRRISSRATFFYKRVSPIIWFGFIALFIVLPLLVGGRTGHFIVPIVMAVVGPFFMKKLIFDLVDEVWDAGDALVVRNCKPVGTDCSARLGCAGAPVENDDGSI